MRTLLLTTVLLYFTVSIFCISQQQIEKLPKAPFKLK